jgi:nicotinamidase-related amidase
MTDDLPSYRLECHVSVPERLTPENTTIVMIDFAVGFANLLGSTELGKHLNNVAGLAKTAKLFGSGLVVTNGLPDKPSGPLYPELLQVLGDHPIVERPGATNAFADDTFAEAVRETGRRNLVIAGVSTEGCVLQSVLGARREGYNVYVCVDATGSITEETHTVAIQRMVAAGATPLTWYSLAGEFEYDHRSPMAPYLQQLMREHVPAMAKGVQSWMASQPVAGG